MKARAGRLLWLGLCAQVWLPAAAQTADTTAPQLQEFTIGPVSIDAADAAVSIAVRIVASDDLAGFGSGGSGNGSIDVRHEQGGNPIGSGSLPITAGDAVNPVFEFTLTMPRYSPPGRYPIALTLVDNVFNSAHFDSARLIELGFPGELQVTSEGDVSAPVLVDLQLSSVALDTTGGAASVQVRIEASDDLSGFGAGGTGSGSIDIRHTDGGNPFGRGSLDPIVEGDPLQPVFEFSLTAPQFSPSGSYPLNLTLVDNLYNTRYYSSEQLIALGFPGVITITSDSDTTPPQLLGLSVTPLQVDSTGAVAITVRIEASDDLAGFGSGGTGNGAFDIRHVSGGNPFGVGSLAISGGDALHPVFEFSVTMPEFSPLGEYPFSLSLLDNVYNSVHFSSEQLRTLGLPDRVLRQVAAISPDADSGNLAVQSDASGRYLVYQSEADGVIAGDDNGAFDILLADTETGELERVSVDQDGDQIAGDSIEPSLAANAELVVFVAPDAGVAKLAGEAKATAAARRKAGTHGVFLRDLLTGRTHRLGQAVAGGVGTTPQLAAGGEVVVFTGETSDPALGKPGQRDVYRVELPRQAGHLVPTEPRCVSCKVVGVDGVDTEADAEGDSERPVVSADGRSVVWQTLAKNHLAGTAAVCPESSTQVVLRDMLTGRMRQLSVPAGSGNCGPAGSGSHSPTIDYSGQQIAFESDQPLNAEQGEADADVFVVKPGAPAPQRVEALAGGEADAAVEQPAVSGDGRWLAFVSAAGNLDSSAGSDGQPHLYLRSLVDGSTRKVSRHSGVGPRELSRPRLNYGGQRLSSDSAPRQPQPGQASQVFVRVNRPALETAFYNGFE